MEQNKQEQDFQFCSLGSGSKGNGTLIRAGKTLLLVDCGFSLKETTKRLLSKGVDPEQLSTILVTHEHSDHIKGVASLSNKFDIPVCTSRGTSLNKHCEKISDDRLNIFNNHTEFVIGEISVLPVPVPHDCREASQFIFSNSGVSLGILTDVGHITPHIRRAYSGCSAMMLEFNYDYQMLMQGKYPRALKQRVAGDLGHLSNEQAVDFLINLESKKPNQLVVMHRSEENNSEEIINGLLKEKFDYTASNFLFANQLDGFDWQIVC
ncbi:MAG: MBL fold metallo-hydrolase [Kangiellaceae bacterium]|nr:MBL fold metallo-hydrolase [Kangiellaceae bacterium]